ncbi:MAG: aminoacyl-tRNA hydrolase [Abditibacteriota bacterium]|nr:aminoacyl-tRNA hydrolase [Abditibacteriota bacterium]
MIVGLGNPGRKYAHTRHNVGFDVLDIFAKKHRLRFRSSPAHAMVASHNHLGEEILLVKPQTYMNESGLAVGQLARKHNITPENIFVIYDDMDLPLGKLRIRPKGSAGGHNGMKSIISHLHSQEFPRMRLGIGHGGEAINHVLGRMSRKDREFMDVSLETAADAIEMFIEEGLEPTMNRFNTAAVND